MSSGIFRFTGVAALAWLLLAFSVRPLLAAEKNPSLQPQLTSPVENNSPDNRASLEKAVTVSNVLNAEDGKAEAEGRLQKNNEDAPNDATDWPVSLPERFIVSKAPPGLREAPPTPKLTITERNSTIEKSQAVANGQFYTVISPIYIGGGFDGGNTSYVRLLNRETNTVVFTISIVGYKAGDSNIGNTQSAVLGTATATVPKFASRQYSVPDILSAAGVSLCLSGDCTNQYSGLALYVKTNSTSTTLKPGFQHVMYNSNSFFFENMTICGDLSLSDGNGTNNYTADLINVHTSIVASLGYPSTIFLHNYASSSDVYKFYISDSDSGLTLGIQNVTLEANASYAIPMSWFEDKAGVTPYMQHGHYNISVYKLNAVGSLTPLNITMGTGVYNKQLRAYLNMSAVCQISH